MSAENDQKPFQKHPDGQKRSNDQSIGSVIEAYKANVNVMAGLLLQLDQHSGQGSMPAELTQNVRGAVVTSVRALAPYCACTLCLRREHCCLQ